MAKAAADPAQKVETNFSKASAAANVGDQAGVSRSVSAEIREIIKNFKLDDYKFLILYDEDDPITSYHADAIYAEASKDTEKKNILLLLNSSGGRIEPAYLISKTLKRLAKERFVVAVPRRAKSAATLIALGADEIHMGMMSELGPIDPQMGGLPALALGNALDVIAELVSRFPDSAHLLEKYIVDQVPVRVLGYYQRVNESAIQYAERLLAGKKLGEIGDAKAVATHLVNHYKDHSFVIDIEESERILEKILNIQSDIYKASDQIFKFLDRLGRTIRRGNKKFWVVGSFDDFYWTERPPT